MGRRALSPLTLLKAPTRLSLAMRLFPLLLGLAGAWAAPVTAPPAIAYRDIGNVERDAANPDSTAARRAVLDVVERLLQAMETRDTALLTSLFVPGARLVGMRQRDSGQVLQALTVQQFAEFVAGDRRERWIERLHQPEVRVDGTLATVWARYDFHFGDRFSHCGTDAFQLLRTSEAWKIVSLADTYRTEGCPESPGSRRP